MSIAIMAIVATVIAFYLEHQNGKMITNPSTRKSKIVTASIWVVNAIMLTYIIYKVHVQG